MGIETHPSIQVNPWVSDYTGSDCKYYYLPLHKTSYFKKEVAHMLGLSNGVEKEFIEVRSSIIKAKKSFHSHVKIPVDRINDKLLLETIDEVKKNDIGVVLQICTSQLSDKKFVKFLKLFSPDFEIEFVLDIVGNGESVVECARFFAKFHFTVPVHKALRWNEILTEEIISLKNVIHLYFPYQLSFSEPYLNCRDSHKVLGLLKKHYPKVVFLPPKGVDIWDRRALNDFDMDPYILPCFETTSKKPEVKFSVVIPTYNNQNHLRVTLKHLFAQDIGLDAFEIIIVDDGGTDQTQELVMQLLEKMQDHINLKYIFFPRPRKRVMGDSQYRAGISRNLGVKNAIGEILCFLDSDIVTPKDYLSRVGEELQDWDALQAKRINLTQSASTLDCSYNGIDKVRDLTSDEAYWEGFVNNTKEWHQLPYSWKYTCTHSFSINSKLFWELGGFKKNFIFYGFEDTDFGYRLAKRGYKLHLLDVQVYHLFHENARSEFMNLNSLRHSLLSKTAQIFYLHHLDEDIYENLLSFMEPEPTLKRFLLRSWEILTLQFVWRRKDRVFKSLISHGEGMF